MVKASDAFRTIGEVSDNLDVPKHVLRFWEGKFPQLKPMKRGGGRRFYRPEDVALLRGIHHLLHAAGYTIKGVQRILREQGVDAVKTLAAGHLAGSMTQTAAVVGATSRSGSKRAIGDTVPVPAAMRSKLAQLANELNDCLALARGAPLEQTIARKAPGRAKRS